MLSIQQGSFPGLRDEGDPVANLWQIYESYWAFPEKRLWCRQQVKLRCKDVPKTRLESLQKEIAELERQYGTYEVILSKTLPASIEEKAVIQLERNIVRYIFIRDMIWFLTEGK